MVVSWRLVAPLFVTSLVLFSGCFDGPGDKASDADQEVPETGDIEAFDLVMSVSGCREITAIIPVSFAHAALFLPAGFAAADLSVMLGTPVDVGQGAVILSNAICSESD